jgi:hypothetical protein
MARDRCNECRNLAFGSPQKLLYGVVLKQAFLPGLRPHLHHVHIAPSFLGLPPTREHISHENKEAVEDLGVW